MTVEDGGYLGLVSRCSYPSTTKIYHQRVDLWVSKVDNVSCSRYRNLSFHTIRKKTEPRITSQEERLRCESSLIRRVRLYSTSQHIYRILTRVISVHDDSTHTSSTAHQAQKPRLHHARNKHYRMTFQMHCIEENNHFHRDRERSFFHSWYLRDDPRRRTYSLPMRCVRPCM